MPRNPKACNHCGATGLVWGRTPQGWRLHNPDSTPHTCVKAVPTAETEPVIEPAPTTETGAGAELWKLIRPIAIKDPHIAGAKVVTHEIRVVNGETERTIEGAHPQTAELLKHLQAGVKPLMVGPAGSGKTKAAEMASEVLGVPFYPLSVGPQTSKSDLMGYMTATGQIVRTALREAFEHGGFFFLDEMDAGNPAVLTAINAAIENAFCGFPDGTISRTDKPFYIAAAGNTYGTGASREYVGRNQLDAATLDRFTVIRWDYDTALEASLSADFPEWHKFILKLRDARERTGIRAVFSTRKVINGVRLLRAGMELDQVKDAVLFGNVSPDDREKLLVNVR